VRAQRWPRATGRFVCYACGAWGSLAEARQRWREEQQRLAALRRPPARPRRAPTPLRRPQLAGATRPPPRPPPAPAPASAQPALAPHLAAFQAALPGSHGEAYLR
jgi:hypothetical protein